MTSSTSLTYQNLQPIRQRRSAILFELINQSVASDLDKRKLNDLVKKYGAPEVAYVNSVFAQQIKERGGLIGDEITIYRRYRRVFAQYGGMRRFFSRKEYDHLMDQFGDLLGARSITLSGLASITRTHSKRYDDIVTGMIERLQKSTTFDFRYNAYMVHLLNDLKAVDAREVIIQAYRQNKVDRKIMDEGSVTILTVGYDEI